MVVAKTKSTVGGYPAIALLTDLAVVVDESVFTVCGQPRVFISHPWDRPFVDTVQAVVHHCSLNSIDPSTCYVFIDVFSINQHTEVPGESGRDSGGKLSLFASVIKSCEQGTLLIGDPW